MIEKIIFSITLVITFDYILTMIKLHDIASRLEKLEEKINALKGEQSND